MFFLFNLAIGMASFLWLPCFFGYHALPSNFGWRNSQDTLKSTIQKPWSWNLSRFWRFYWLSLDNIYSMATIIFQVVPFWTMDFYATIGCTFQLFSFPWRCRSIFEHHAVLCNWPRRRLVPWRVVKLEFGTTKDNTPSMVVSGSAKRW